MIHDLERRFASYVEMADKLVVNAISENLRSELCVFVPKSKSGDFLGKMGLLEEKMKKISIEDEVSIKEFNDNSLTKILVIEENGVIVVRTRDVNLISSVISAYQLKEQ